MGVLGEWDGWVGVVGWVGGCERLLEASRWLVLVVEVVGDGCGWVVF